MSETETRAETHADVLRAREVSASRHPGREPVTVRTTCLSGEKPTREERMRAGLHRLALEGRITLPS